MVATNHVLPNLQELIKTQLAKIFAQVDVVYILGVICAVYRGDFFLFVSLNGVNSSGWHFVKGWICSVALAICRPSVQIRRSYHAR